MKRPTLLKILNPLLFLSAVFQIISIVFKVLSIDNEFFDEGHEINGFILVGLILLHVILNWPWIKSLLMKKKA